MAQTKYVIPHDAALTNKVCSIVGTQLTDLFYAVSATYPADSPVVRFMHTINHSPLLKLVRVFPEDSRLKDEVSCVRSVKDSRGNVGVQEINIFANTPVPTYAGSDNATDEACFILMHELLHAVLGHMLQIEYESLNQLYIQMRKGNTEYLNSYIQHIQIYHLQRIAYPDSADYFDTLPTEIMALGAKADELKGMHDSTEQMLQYCWDNYPSFWDNDITPEHEPVELVSIDGEIDNDAVTLMEELIDNLTDELNTDSGGRDAGSNIPHTPPPQARGAYIDRLKELNLRAIGQCIRHALGMVYTRKSSWKISGNPKYAVTSGLKRVHVTPPVPHVILDTSGSMRMDSSGSGLTPSDIVTQILTKMPEYTLTTFNTEVGVLKKRVQGTRYNKLGISYYGGTSMHCIANMINPQSIIITDARVPTSEFDLFKRAAAVFIINNPRVPGRHNFHFINP